MQELIPVRSKGNGERFLPAFKSAEASWARTPSQTRGAELLLAAMSYDPHSKQALAAAEQLLDGDPGSPIARAFARRFIDLPPEHDAADFIPGTTPPGSIASSKSIIRQLRMRTQRWPRNPLTWIDLARAYFVLGLDEKARRSLEVGLALDPDNRFVVRSAARFFVHVGDEERASTLVNRARGSSDDPWLQSVNVALGREGRRRSLRQSLKLIEDRSLTPWHVAELGAALATSEFEHGQSRRARQLMRTALIDPTENALAHAEWATHLGVEAMPDRALPRAPHEALARRHAHMLEWREAAQWARYWLDDEPFSPDAASLGSWYAIESEDFDAAIEITTIGLTANPDNPTLLNNRAFAFACDWKLKEATADILAVDVAKADATSVGCVLATAGFISYRGGHVDQGRGLYERAIRHFAALRDSQSCARAAANLAAEDMRTQSPWLAESIARATELVQSSKSQELTELWQRIQTAERVGGTQPAGWRLLEPISQAVAELPARMNDADES